jgi:predicted transcriptional regulator
MSSPLITINPNSSIRNVMETMQQEGICRLPVVDDGTKILGIITNKDKWRHFLLWVLRSIQMVVDHFLAHGKDRVERFDSACMILSNQQILGT